MIGAEVEFTSEDGRARKVPLAALESMVVDVDHVRGGFEGAGLGFLAGAAAGAVVGFSLGSDPPLPPNSDCGPCSFTAGTKALFLGLAGGVLGLGVGAIAGAIVGHRDVVELTDA